MDASLRYYRKFVGLDIPFFDAVGAAPLMDIYTKNETITKRASMVMNLQGGCAMEVISPTSFKPSPAAFSILPGDFGIFAVQIRTTDIQKSLEFCRSNEAKDVSDIELLPDGRQSFYISDLDGNVFQYVQDSHQYIGGKCHCAGVLSCSVGVSNIDESRKLYSDILGYDQVVYDSSEHTYGYSEEWKGRKVRRVLLTQKAGPGGGFAKVVGNTGIELVQLIDGEPNKIFADRIWADNGFVHIGFDVKGMTGLGEDLAKAGFGFTCDSNDALDMGTTKVHCTYIEDVDGTLIEMIEVYKVPIIEKWGVFMNVEKRDPLKPFPDLMLKSLRFSRIKD